MFKRLLPFFLMLLAGATPAPAQVKKELTKENELVISTPVWKMVFAGERGGELNKVMLFDGDRWYQVNSTFAFKSLDTLPALSFTSTKDSYYSGKWDVYYANEGRNCKFEVLKELPGEIHFKVSNRPRVMENGKVGPWVVTYTWHVYEVGVVFCDFEISLPTKEDTFELAWSLLGMHVEDYMFKEKHQGKTAKFMWNWGMLDKTTDRGRWQPPVMSSTEAQPLDIDFSRNTQPELLGFVPYGSAAFNLDHLPDTSFTNAMEVVWEDAKPMVGTDLTQFGTHFKYRQSGLSPPPTWMGSDRNPPTFSFEWNLYHGPNVELVGPFSYRNRFGMGFTTQRTTGNPDAHPVMKNRLQGARIFHWMNAGKSGAAWYPSAADVDKMAAGGANVLILGEPWRTSPTYKPTDADALKRTVDACHSRDMRVALTMRGEDYPILERDTSWFTDYLRPESDGLYVIHPGFLYSPTNPNAYPVKIAGEEIAALGSSKTHTDAYANFLWSKKLRRLVGANGFLIGETDPLIPTRIGLAYFDAYAPDIGGLSGTLDRSVYARFHTGNGCTPRAALGRLSRGGRPRAFAAAYGDAPIVTLGAGPGEPTDPADPQNAAFANLWKIYRAADLERASRHDTVSQADKVYKLDTANCSGTLYRISEDEMMLVLANLGPSTNAAVTLDFKKLNMPAGDFAARVMKISPGDEYSEPAPITVTNGVFQTGEMSRFEVAAYHMKRK